MVIHQDYTITVVRQDKAPDPTPDPEPDKPDNSVSYPGFSTTSVCGREYKIYKWHISFKQCQ